MSWKGNLKDFFGLIFVGHQVEYIVFKPLLLQGLKFRAQ